MTTADVVCTTIGDGSFLKHYAAALAGAEARMIVIPDRKTPKALYAAVDEARAAGITVECPDPEAQPLFTFADLDDWDIYCQAQLEHGSMVADTLEDYGSL